MPPVAHSILGASSAGRWMRCPGSIRLSAGVTRRESEYAAEGTAAHGLAESCLRSGMDASAYTEKYIRLENGKEFLVPLDMVEAVQLYLDTVRADKAATPRAEFAFEQSFHLGFLHPDLFGTNDALVGEPYGLLRIYDYKHGEGIAVEAEDNAQLKYYALGAAHGQDYEAVELVVVQPRARHKDGPIRRWRCTIEELETWGRDMLVPAAKATEAPDAPLVSGSHCRFCPARPFCPEIEKEALAAAGQVFGSLPADPRTIELPVPEELSYERVARVLLFAETFSGWIDAVKAFAKDEMKAGREIPGWKLVHGRASRYWKAEPCELEKALPIDALYEMKMRTVAQAEATIKKSMGKAFKAFKSDVFDSLVSVSKAVVIAPEHDARPAINPQLEAVEIFSSTPEDF